MKQAGTQILVADIGGTNARVGIFIDSNESQAAPSLLNIQHFLCNEYKSLEDLLLEYIEHHCEQHISILALAVAGHEIEGTIIGINLAWRCSIDSLKRKLGMNSVYVLNDFAATAYATMFLNPADVLQLNSNQKPNTEKEETILVVGPGTGFGCSIQPPGKMDRPLCSEAGHMGFAPSNDLEFELVAVMRRTIEQVTIEHLLSGPGISYIYLTLCEIESRSKEECSSDQICMRASAESDSVYGRTMDTFFSILGSVTADLALALAPHAGIYLAGGILPKNRELLLNSKFLKRFMEKDMLYGFLQKLPITLITYPYTGMLGAAVWANSRQ